MGQTDRRTAALLNAPDMCRGIITLTVLTNSDIHRPNAIGVTALIWDAWDASPPTLAIMRINCIGLLFFVHSNFCDWHFSLGTVGGLSYVIQKPNLRRRGKEEFCSVP